MHRGRFFRYIGNEIVFGITYKNNFVNVSLLEVFQYCASEKLSSDASCFDYKVWWNRVNLLQYNSHQNLNDHASHYVFKS